MTMVIMVMMGGDGASVNGGETLVKLGPHFQVVSPKKMRVLHGKFMDVDDVDDDS